jgi:predicted HAD superfamily Cof-like phosphohydrolase
MIAIYKSNMDKVVEFHRAMNLGIGDQDFPDRSTHRLRMNLIFEELTEFIEAKAKGDKNNAVKELCDILYVVYGYGATMGVDLDYAFAQVHEANMSKLDSMGKPVIRADGKVMKGPNYKPVDEKKLVKAIKS